MDQEAVVAINQPILKSSMMSWQEKMQQAIIYIIITLFALTCILPFILVIIVSFTAEASIIRHGYSFFPAEWSLDAYRVLFGPTSMVFNSYIVTVFVTAVGTLAAILMTFGAAYALASRHCRYRDGLALYFYITMVFSAGLVPWYLINRNLGIYNNIWALIIPSLMFSPFNMFLMRNFIRGIPEELNDSARIDGAGEIRTAFSIYLPLCLPTIATISLFYAIGYWNNFFNALMLVHERTLFPLQLILFRIASEMSQMNMTPDGVARAMPPREGFTMATALITMGPIILLYPFLQRYFVKGIVLGAVKG